jgi:hypothetical protein
MVSVIGRPSVAAIAAAASWPSRWTRRNAAASAADPSVTSGPSHRSASTVSPGALKTEATTASASSPSNVVPVPQQGMTWASSGVLSRFGAHAANSPPGRSTRRAARIGGRGSS